MDLRHGHFSVKMYAKMKELGPIGGHAPGMPSLDPPMITTLKMLNYNAVFSLCSVSKGLSVNAILSNLQ